MAVREATGFQDSRNSIKPVLQTKNRYKKKYPAPGWPRRSRNPLTVASFRTWRGWAAPARTVPDIGLLILLQHKAAGQYRKIIMFGYFKAFTFLEFNNV